jgi:hypothetical protein
MKQIWGALYGSVLAIALLVTVGGIYGGVNRLGLNGCGIPVSSDSQTFVGGMVTGVIIFLLMGFFQAAAGGAVVGSILIEFLPHDVIRSLKAVVEPSNSSLPDVEK